MLVDAVNVLTAGLRTNFVAMYERFSEANAGIVNALFGSVPSDKLTEIYAYFESAPYARRWDRGHPLTANAFKGVQFSVTNLDWGVKVPWHENDRQDDQTKSLLRIAANAGMSWGILDERVAFQFLLGSTDPDLLLAIPNAPDGNPLFYGSTRFGHANGNIVSGSTVGTAGNIQTDLYAAITRVLLFQDTQGQPLFPRSMLTKGIHIIYGVANDKVFREAFFQQPVLQIVKNVAASENVAAAAVSNIIQQSGLQFELHPTPRITSNDWYVVFAGTEYRPLILQNRMPLREIIATMENDAISRSTKEEYMQWDARRGYGCNLPYGIIQIDN